MKNSIYRSNFDKNIKEFSGLRTTTNLTSKAKGFVLARSFSIRRVFDPQTGKYFFIILCVSGISNMLDRGITHWEYSKEVTFYQKEYNATTAFNKERIINWEAAKDQAIRTGKPIPPQPMLLSLPESPERPGSEKLVDHYKEQAKKEIAESVLKGKSK